MHLWSIDRQMLTEFDDAWTDSLVCSSAVMSNLTVALELFG